MNRPVASARFESAVPARFTAAEFLRMADLGAFDDMKVELDHGEIIRMNPPHNDHSFALGTVMRALFEAVPTGAIAVVPEIAILLPDETVRAFDAALVRSEAANEKLLLPRHVVLAIEVSDSSLEYDLGPKLRDYAAAGIAYYWVVDVQAKAVRVMSAPREDGYGKSATIRFGEALELPEGLGTILLG